MATIRTVNVVDPVDSVAVEGGSASGALTALIVLAVVAIAFLIGYFAWYSPGHAVQSPSSNTVIERDSTTNRSTTNNTAPAPAPVIIHDNPPASTPPASTPDAGGGE